VVVFVGDGAIGYHGVELDTAERYHRPVIVVVLDDQKWGAIALPQQRTLGRDYGVDLKQRDWGRFAEALGGLGYRAETMEAVRAAVAEAHQARRPAVVQVPVECVISPFMNAFGF
jgi:acetolactate synthase-1/2/3 large subunit